MPSLTARKLFASACSAVCVVWALPITLTAQTVTQPPVRRASAADQKRLEFFENKIRPILHEYCLDCHSSETELSGGLSLDSRTEMLTGGDSGPSITPGNAEDSLFWNAVAYADPNLQMPPEGKLPAQVLENLRTWIQQGAADPRVTTSQAPVKTTALPVDRAQEHWAYQPIEQNAAHGTGPVLDTIDDYIARELNRQSIEPTQRASDTDVARRIFYDLTGMLPKAEELGSAAPTVEQLPQLVDRLLESPEFGERFARQWMDVARYADSITLRGFVLPQAWRYRDYLIDAFNQDRPFDQMVRDQVAGDLLQYSSAKEREMQLVATGFLALGNTNLERQDKQQLEMDFIDEQLEVMGRAFLGQTLGCARCHDHKFDPIPTRDYYALAGVMRSAVALEHENVSKWIEQPLPLGPEEQAKYLGLKKQANQLASQIANLKLELGGKPRQGSIAIDSLAGVVVDNSAATRVGNWKRSTHSGSWVGDGYIHDENAMRGSKSVTFEPVDLPAGTYQVRLSYNGGPSRSRKIEVVVASAAGETKLHINQRDAPADDGLWLSLGEFFFETDGQAFVRISNAGSDGYVIADAVQFLPVDRQQLTVKREESTSKQSDLDSLQSQRAAIIDQLAERPRYLTVSDSGPRESIAVNIRGDVHNLGSVAPRGFLTAIVTPDTPTIAKDSSGRVELAQWLSSPDNPLTARVYVNRVWGWLMGEGLVRTPNNFGTTGVPPTHPELLDQLTRDFIRSGWSTKQLVRRIVLSQAYARASDGASNTAAVSDPENRLVWRGHVRRLDAEGLRDSMLLVSGELDPRRGGPAAPWKLKADYNFEHASLRRSVYQAIFRNALPPLVEAFDFADPSVSIGKRPRSTVATQSLVMLNHPWVIKRAQAAAKRIAMESGSGSADDFVRRAYARCLQRKPSADELRISLEFLDDASEEEYSQRLGQFVHALFGSVDFRYLR